MKKTEISDCYSARDPRRDWLLNGNLELSSVPLEAGRARESQPA